MEARKIKVVDYNKIGKRIKLRRDNLDLTQSNLAKLLGFNKSTIQRYETGKIKNIKMPVIQELAKILNVSEAWLMGCDVPMHKYERTNQSIFTEREKALIKEYQVLNEQGKDKADERVHELTEIPRYVNYEINEENIFNMDLYDLPVSAGTGIYLCDESKATIQVKKTAIAIKSDFALRISGDSMIPAFDDGDIILVKSVPCVEKGEIGIFVINSNSYIKKFGGDRLISLNSNYKDIIFSKYDTICCLGKVLGKAEILQG